MSYGRNENDEKALSRFKLIVSLTSLWIPQAYPPQLLHFKAFISGKSHEAFRPENVLLINRSYHEGSSLTLFIFFLPSTASSACSISLFYWCRSLSLGFLLPKSSVPQTLPAFPSYPFPSPLPLLSCDLAPARFDFFSAPAPLTAHSCPGAASHSLLAQLSCGTKKGLNTGTVPAKIGNCFTSWISSHTS